MKKLSLLCVFIFIVLISQGQKKSSRLIWGPSVGYQYQSTNFLKAGGWIFFSPNEVHPIRIDAGANFSWLGQGTTLIPELGFTYYLSSKLFWPFLKAEATPYSLTPKAGVSILSLIDLGVGYGWDINNNSRLGQIEGLTFSVDLKIPLNLYR